MGRRIEENRIDRSSDYISAAFISYVTANSTGDQVTAGAKSNGFR